MSVLPMYRRESSYYTSDEQLFDRRGTALELGVPYTRGIVDLAMKGKGRERKGKGRHGTGEEGAEGDSLYTARLVYYFSKHSKQSQLPQELTNG